MTQPCLRALTLVSVWDSCQSFSPSPALFRSIRALKATLFPPRTSKAGSIVEPSPVPYLIWATGLQVLRVLSITLVLVLISLSPPSSPLCLSICPGLALFRYLLSASALQMECSCGQGDKTHGGVVLTPGLVSLSSFSLNFTIHVITHASQAGIAVSGLTLAASLTHQPLSLCVRVPFGLEPCCG
ncbi:unnamed protein product [Protopolystoma xenopodis]|uniref:Uncharacterized protein n=1 Tax=Protopolystoma xenopodis TaxID=117903 RepID=A0A448XFD5_9PLAT|nr:unnamed protein product [Protopolystoma xenopodis]